MSKKFAIEILNGPQEGDVKELTKTFLSIGSLMSDDLRFDSSTGILPSHAAIRIDDDKVILTNQCYSSITVNDKIINEVELVHNDIIQFGSIGPKLKFLDPEKSDNNIKLNKNDELDQKEIAIDEIISESPVQISKSTAVIVSDIEKTNETEQDDVIQIPAVIVESKKEVELFPPQIDSQYNTPLQDLKESEVEPTHYDELNLNTKPVKTEIEYFQPSVNYSDDDIDLSIQTKELDNTPVAQTINEENGVILLDEPDESPNIDKSNENKEDHKSLTYISDTSYSGKEPLNKYTRVSEKTLKYTFDTSSGALIKEDETEYIIKNDNEVELISNKQNVKKNPGSSAIDQINDFTEIKQALQNKQVSKTTNKTNTNLAKPAKKKEEKNVPDQQIVSAYKEPQINHESFLYSLELFYDKNLKNNVEAIFNRNNKFFAASGYYNKKYYKEMAQFVDNYKQKDSQKQYRKQLVSAAYRIKFEKRFYSYVIWGTIIALIINAFIGFTFMGCGTFLGIFVPVLVANQLVNVMNKSFSNREIPDRFFYSILLAASVIVLFNILTATSLLFTGFWIGMFAVIMLIIFIAFPVFIGQLFFSMSNAAVTANKDY